MLQKTIYRLKADYSEIIENACATIFAEPMLISSDKNNEQDLFNWKGFIIGPEGTPYYGGKFMLYILFPKDYPYSPPMITFDTKIYHPNINRHGSICINILKDNWSPILTVFKILLSISSLLSEPNGNDPLEPEIANTFMSDIDLYNKTAKEWTHKYAC